MGYEELLVILDTIPELEESRQYYVDCLEAVDGRIKAIDDKIELLNSEDENIRDKYALYGFKLERVDLISRKKSYESYLNEKIKALDRNRVMEKELEQEIDANFDVVVEQLRNSTNQKHKELKSKLSFTDFSKISEKDKKRVYVKIKSVL